MFDSVRSNMESKRGQTPLAVAERVFPTGIERAFSDALRRGLGSSRAVDYARRLAPGRPLYGNIMYQPTNRRPG